MNPRPKKLAALQALFILPLIALVVLVVFLLGSMIHSLPLRAEELYGPSSSRVTGPQLYYQSLILIWQQEKLTSAVNPNRSAVTLDIQPGDSPGKVIQQLQSLGVISHPTLFRTYLVYSGIDRAIQPGSYQLEPGLTPLQIARLFQDPAPGDTTLVILPGWRAEEIASTFSSSGLELSPAAFLQVIREEGAEGYLYPGVYQVPRDIPPRDLIRKMVDRFYQELTTELREGFRAQNLSLAEAVILASIVEREAVVEEEMTLISSVFLNRLKAGMPLEADPTVQYARGHNAGQNTWWTNPLSSADLRIDSPYNTYLYGGLPPAPIANPGPEALGAVASPADTEWFYFRAACDGSGRHNFSADYQEHLDHACP